MSLESIAPQFFTAPPTKIDGIPAAITTDLGIHNDLSDRGTGIGFDKPWTQEQIDSVAARAANNVTPDRVTR
ncbi:MAG: hypothetical protein ABSB70_09670 [Candidatus Velthaea sp.]|jgi:hypothetical protein